MPNFQDEKHIPRRCEPDDPHRCQATARGGDQCCFLAVPGRKYCPIHQNPESRPLYSFEREFVQTKLQDFTNNPKARSLAEELSVLRMVFERAINNCEDPTDLVMQSPQIITLADKIQSVLIANTKLEEKVGSLMSVAEVTEIAEKLFAIITTHVQDPDTLEAIAHDFEYCLTEVAREH